MNFFNFLSSVYRKLKWVLDFVFVYLGPIYDELIKVIKAVNETDLENEAARKEVFQRMTDFIQARGLNISDSILNLSIEMVYQLIKNKKV
jgi:hypothetical protein